MLFDLRGRGRRRTIQGIYLFLALLMGGGLIFFGVGGTGVGLFNTGNDSGGGSGNDVLEKRLSQAEKRVKRQPEQAAAWAALARARFTVAGNGENYDNIRNTYTRNGLKELRLAGRAWKRYLNLEPEQADATLAQQMVNAYLALNDAKGAVRALEVVAEERPSAGVYQQLAIVAYAAKQERKGDLAAAQAVERTPKANRKQVKQRLDLAKKQSTQTAPVTGGNTPGTTTLPVKPKG